MADPINDRFYDHIRGVSWYEDVMKISELETNIERYVEELGLKDVEIHRLRNKAQVAYAMVGEAVIFFESVKADHTVPAELRNLAKIWLTDYYEFFPQPEPIHHGNK